MLKVGIVGLPNVGKSTLFRALTKREVNIANYPFVTIEPNIGVVEVLDERVDKLAEISRSKKKIYAMVEFVDIAGLVRGAHSGEGLGNAFLAHIKEVDAVCEVVRVFEDSDTIHVEITTDPARDTEIIDLELGLKDLETATIRQEGLSKRVKAGDKNAEMQLELLEIIIKKLREGVRASDALKESGLDLGRPEYKTLLQELSLLGAKQRIFVFNGSEKQIKEKWRPDEKLLSAINGDPWILLSAKVEDELNALSGEDRMEYLKTLGLEYSGLDQLIRLSYQTLGLITFLTTGEDETRAWTIPALAKAPRAGRAIHSDFEEKFIRAEVIPYQKLKDAGSYLNAREKGWIQTEGREYEVRDGDVIEFKI